MPNPDLASQFTVNPAALDGCGQSAQHIGGQIPGETTKITAPSDQASATLAGWQTAASLHNCSTNWKTLLDKLGGDMSTCGSKLVQTAAGYRQGEQSAYAHLRGSNAAAAGGAPAGAATDPFGTVLASETAGAGRKDR
ncbi:hypothetical protein [Streptomyces sp. CB01881]|uniref:WXG100 family type VII secretion target n=1 Tax=Streptomyces sp. CB01881 TaxID=2078691 RepID=UPI000CDC4DB1|nr:hypothetical protein [Streptomyces sp. CB01881]AUY50601.1 hypothetical protein C2142_18490 [Streptomyces sp. CB01881]TYC73987.1 hypothetical protein EH183_18460 [Streptomyces sp. CB01881]